MSRSQATFSKADAAVGAGRFILAPASADVELLADPFAVLPGVRGTNGAYEPALPFFDVGLMSDAPTISHSAETSGLEYANYSGVLFERVQTIEQSVTLTLSSMNPAVLAIIDNVDPDLIEEVASAAGKPGWTKIPVGSYTQGLQYRALGVYDYASADATDVITEPGGRTRPRSLMRVVPLMSLAIDEDRDIEFDPEDGVSCEVQMKIVPELSLPVDEQRGYWAIEKPGTIVAA